MRATRSALCNGCIVQHAVPLASELLHLPDLIMSRPHACPHDRTSTSDACSTALPPHSSMSVTRLFCDERKPHVYRRHTIATNASLHQPMIDAHPKYSKAGVSRTRSAGRRMRTRRGSERTILRLRDGTLQPGAVRALVVVDIGFGACGHVGAQQGCKPLQTRMAEYT